MTNPFDLRGPEFLVFYLFLGSLTLLAAGWLRWSHEADSSPARPLHDYLQIAFLRGGAVEAVSVAILSLIDRGLLTIEGNTQVRAVREDASEGVSKATERWILQRSRTVSETTDLVSDSIVTGAASRECEAALVDHGLMPNDAQRVRRQLLFLLATLMLVAVAGIKIMVAVSRGRSNIVFLLIATVGFVALVGFVTHPRRTPAGSALLADLRTLFAGLRERARAGEPFTNGSDFALFAAVFGVSAALSVRPEATVLFQRRTTSSFGSYCGSTCGSSCGSSCGGGCGGGCGGCGS